ncbi:hypothetical protein [Natronorarus salvus]|uniref:hypothetical protein n=1 Tax=Natronorarus salvus TaxID=3117733 RepID=UPI002F260CEF
MFADEDEVIEQVGYRLMSQGVYFQSVEERGGELRIEYETVAPGEGIPRQQMGRVINTFRDAIEEGWEPTGLHVAVYDTDGEFRGRWGMEAEWLRSLEAEELTEVEFSRRVLSTVSFDEREDS